MPGPQSKRSDKFTRTNIPDAPRTNSRNAAATDRAFLVGLDYRRKVSRPKAGSSRPGANASTDTFTKAPPVPEFSAEESLDELRSLAMSAGAEIAGEFLQRRDRPDAATLVGKGKLEEIAGAAASVSANLVLFDHDLTASQQRNIEKVVGVRVIDRTQLILDIFARRARTREGQLQVELAQLEYMLPRLTGRGAEMSQLGGGIGTRGPGETQLETDRRKIFRRVRNVKQQLENVRKVRAQQRQRRESTSLPTIALVGYTNAGKSTLFNAITQAAVLESSRMFATLDPTIRGIVLPSHRQALLSDTVGFIRSLPHTLVSAFRATLEELQSADLILHVSDASSPLSTEQDAQVEKVLQELEVDGKPRLRVLNKIDLLTPDQRASLSGDSHFDGNSVCVSAIGGIGLDTLKLKIDDKLTQDALSQVKLRIPQNEGKMLALLEGKSKILRRRYEAGFVLLEVEAAESVLRRLKKWISKSSEVSRARKNLPSHE